jgi:pyruvate dehydrogenase E1 component alpha subunit
MELNMTPDQVRGKSFFRGKGCENCNKSGYRGRMALFEIMTMDDEMRDLIMKQANTTTLRAHARKRGMRSLRECGLLGGKGGSMHLTDVSKGAMGSYAIIGAHLPVAAGAAWSAQYRGTEQVSVCFFGDGTTNIGAFHEALNFAVIWKLPVIFVCENNLYMEYTPIHTVTAVEHPAADRASAYGLEKIVVDGNDADAVYRTATKYIDRARKGGGPALIECMTYRHSGHSRADPGKYRPEGELEKWLERDPIKIYRERLLGLGIVDATLKDIEDEVMQQVNEATEIAKASAPPSLDGIYEHVWADGGASWRN